jgi:hypothetical protein
VSSANPLLLVAGGHLSDTITELQEHPTFIVDEDENGCGNTDYDAKKKCTHDPASGGIIFQLWER